MTDTHHAGEHHGPDFRIYMAIGLALSGFTIISFLCNYWVRHGVMSPMTAFILILGVAVVKATLVGMYFMHLRYEWGKLYFMIIPAFILGTMMMIVLLPDIVVAWHVDQYEASAAQQSGNP